MSSKQFLAHCVASALSAALCNLRVIACVCRPYPARHRSMCPDVLQVAPVFDRQAGTLHAELDAKNPRKLVIRRRPAAVNGASSAPTPPSPIEAPPGVSPPSTTHPSSPSQAGHLLAASLSQAHQETLAAVDVQTLCPLGTSPGVDKPSPMGARSGRPALTNITNVLTPKVTLIHARFPLSIPSC